MANEVREHISVVERTRWDKVVSDFAIHLGSGGDVNHRRADGTVSGFSINDYTTEEKTKLSNYATYPRIYDLSFANNEFILTGRENGVQVSQEKCKQTTYRLLQAGNTISLLGTDGSNNTVTCQALAIWG